LAAYRKEGAAALARLGANLVWVWGFNATRRTLQLYDRAAPRLSNLSTLALGGCYWTLQNRDHTVTLGSGTYTLSAG
jgi:hypothetical protein